MTGHGDESVAVAFVYYVEGSFDGSGSHDQRAGYCFAFECAGDVWDDSFAIAVEDLACAELFNEREVGG
jgi:hypothetical protein